MQCASATRGPRAAPTRKVATSSGRVLSRAARPGSRGALVVRNVAEMSPSTPSGTSNGVPKPADALADTIKDKVEYVGGGDRDNITTSDAYTGAAWAVREPLFKAFNDTHKHWAKEDPKFVYYLSAEFLMGRSFQNVVLNLGLGEEYTEALKNVGHAFEEVAMAERDASLGNGGLGRLAACFLDSMATLDLPGWGYGIRYKYGMFKQALKDGYQMELPDVWLQAGNPYEQIRAHINYDIGFYGSVVDGKWVPAEGVKAVAYDNPIPGFETKNATNLRLWDCQPQVEFDLEAFNEGAYEKATEAKRKAEDIAAVLYPNDATAEGKELRLKQQYFFVSASLQDTIARYLKSHPEDTSLAGLPDKAIFQLNDTHPTIGVAEMMRLLVDVHGLAWDEAWATSKKCFAFTNHTVMPEALEKWPVTVIGKLLPRHMEIIEQIDSEWEESLKAFHGVSGLSLPKEAGEGEEKAEAEAPELTAEQTEKLEKIARMAIVQENQWVKGEMLVNMAYLAVVGSSFVNGVAAIHSEIIKKDIFPDFMDICGDKFQNKTNGVTPRRWLSFCNPELADLITDTLGTDKWTTDVDLLQGLVKHAEDPAFRAKWKAVKQTKKAGLAAMIQKLYGEDVNMDAMFDVQIKRIHEYKRQYMNVLSVIWRYKQLKAMSPEERKNTVPRVVVIGGKAASAYDLAKRIVRLVTAVGDKINHDPDTNEYLKLFFIPDYNVTAAETLIPGADLSQHISTAGTEASGTSNMKFQMNGALIIGTMDGANVEIAEESGKENMFVFGVDADEIDDLRKTRRDFVTDDRWNQIMDWIMQGEFGDVDYFRPLVDSVHNMNVGNDWFLLGNDFATYLDAQEEVDKCWQDQDEWIRRSIVYTATSGKFSSDRTIAQYADEIWNVKPNPLP